MYYLTILLALSTFYGCSSHTIIIDKKRDEYKKEIIIEESKPYTLGQRENFTSLEFRQLMKDLDHTLFVELDSKLFRGKDWLEYNSDMKKTLKDFIENSRKIKSFSFIQENEEFVRLTKRLITYEYFLQDVVKNEKFDYVKPAFDKVVNACVECHNIMK
jgi:hypothetical protein